MGSAARSRRTRSPRGVTARPRDRGGMGQAGVSGLETVLDGQEGEQAGEEERQCTARRTATMASCHGLKPARSPGGRTRPCAPDTSPQKTLEIIKGDRSSTRSSACSIPPRSGHSADIPSSGHPHVTKTHKKRRLASIGHTAHLGKYGRLTTRSRDCSHRRATSKQAPVKQTPASNHTLPTTTTTTTTATVVERPPPCPLFSRYMNHWTL